VVPDQRRYTELVQRLTAWAARRGSPAAADAAHEALVRTLKHPGAGPALRSYLDDSVAPARESEEWRPSNVYAWLYRVVENVVSEQRRGASRREVPVADANDWDGRDGSDDALTLAIKADSAVRLRSVLATLEPNVRQALTMWSQDRTYAEIAAALGRKQNTVATWIHRGWQELSRRFHAEAAASHKEAGE
jgi:DNA-directed RNA polymerase specialized sigma24 family protein